MTVCCDHPLASHSTIPTTVRTTGSITIESVGWSVCAECYWEYADRLDLWRWWNPRTWRVVFQTPVLPYRHRFGEVRM